MIEWFSSKNRNDYVTIDAKSLTFSIGTKKILETAYKAMLGVDKNNGIIHLKLLNSDLANRGDLDQSMLNHISIGKSYARITNKSFIDYLIQNGLINFKNNKCLKFKIYFDKSTNDLIINLKEEIV
ncbi:MAG: hypothetical protein SO087_00140 [Candidatus Onthovivens sp.]|nr:hypothetical protein [Candidatus Onthovivens sp.]